MTNKKSRLAPLNIAPSEFRKLGYDLVDRVADLIESMDNRKVVEFCGPEEIQRLINADNTLPHEGSNAAEILAETADLLMKYSV